MFTASDFRDASMAGLSIAYDWVTSRHSAELVLVSPKGEHRRFRLVGLKEWSGYEDFGAQYVERCTLLHESSGIYLSLDPYTEGCRSEQDNLWFVCASVEPSSGSNNSSKPTPLRGAA